MAEPSAALYDFAVATHGDVDLDLLVGLVLELREKYAELPPMVELYGRSSAGEIIALFRFPFAAYSAALRKRMSKEAERLKGRLVETELLSSSDRARFYGERLAGFDVRVDATASPREAVESFRERMGLSASRPAYLLQFSTPEDIAVAWARQLSEGSLFVPSRRLPEQGARVGLIFSAPGCAPLDAEAEVVEVVRLPTPGFHASAEAGPALQEFLARRHAEGRQGKVREAGGRRQEPRFDTCLEVQFADYPELRGEWAANISKGGLFVRTTRPPPLRAKVRLRLLLPGSQTAETTAEVVHAVSVQEAAERRCPPGVGLAFGSDAAFRARVEAVIAELERRRPRVLVADQDAFFRRVLGEALTLAGMDVDGAADGHEALSKLAEGLFELDALVLDLDLPGVDGYSVIDRIRRVGGEADLVIVVVANSSSLELEKLRGPHAANDAIRKGTPLEQIVRRIRRLVSPGYPPGE